VNDNETGAGNRTFTYDLANRLATTPARGTTTTTYTFGRKASSGVVLGPGLFQN